MSFIEILHSYKYLLKLSYKNIKNSILVKEKFITNTNKFFCTHTQSGLFKLTLKELFNEWMRKFENNQISEPKESIEYILAYVMKLKKDIYYFDNKPLNKDQIQKIHNLCEKRLKRMPIQYVIQEWDFRNLTLKMCPPVFIPRPETEGFVDLILKEIDKKKSKKLLELCCGSGAITISLLTERPSLEITTVDYSSDACNLTRINGEKYNVLNRLRIIQKEINDENKLNFIKEKFDLIVSNPPYVFTKDMKTLQPEIILYEDLKALDGGPDGLSLIKIILNASNNLLNKHGKLFLEVDPFHPDMIIEYIANNKLGLLHSCTHNDICGKKRFIELTYK